MDEMIERMKEIVVKHFNDTHIGKIDKSWLFLAKSGYLNGDAVCIFRPLNEESLHTMYEVSYCDEYLNYEVKVMYVKEEFVVD